MGFKSKSSRVAAPANTVASTIPVVTDVVENDTEAAYEQESSRKKGLLSTLLSSQRKREQEQGSFFGNKTLG